MMKQVCTGVAIMVSMAAGMAAGAYLVMNNSRARHLYRMGKRKAKQMLNI